MAMAAGATPVQADPKAAAWTPGEALVKEASALSDDQKLDASRKALAQIRDAVSAVTRTQQEAFAAKDAIRLSCVEDKLLQVKGALKIAENASASLEGAAARKDGTAATNEYARVALAREKARKLQGEAAQCAGKDAGDGRADIDVEEPAGLMADQEPLLVAPPVGRPPAASPTN